MSSHPVCWPNHHWTSGKQNSIQEAEIALKYTKFQNQIIWIIFYKGHAVSSHERTWRICIRNAFSHFISPTHVNDRHDLHDCSVCCTAIPWSDVQISGVSPDLLPSYPTAQTYISPVSQFSMLQMPLARSMLFHFSPFSLLLLLLFFFSLLSIPNVLSPVLY